MNIIILVTGILTTLHTGFTCTSDVEKSPATQEQKPLIYNNQDDAQLRKDCKDFSGMGVGCGTISMFVIAPVCAFNHVSIGLTIAALLGVQVLGCVTGMGIAALKARCCNGMYSEDTIDV